MHCRPPPFAFAVHTIARSRSHSHSLSRLRSGNAQYMFCRAARYCVALVPVTVRSLSTAGSCA
eukprot:EW705337.1.p4 GENE.EW705337.1~~EW705337.1.p4  ORF type:complete len:63 (+),score=15.50 EW705337.1:188-376(+)